MSDVRHMYVWENQRWNPVTGFTYRGLPTDRHTWSDQTGRHHRTKDMVKLPNRHWSWVSLVQNYGHQFGEIFGTTLW